MKKSLFRALTVGTIILMALVCFGCPKEPKIKASFTFKSMPYDATGMYAQLWPIDKDNNLLKIIDFGKITQSQHTYSCEMPPKTAGFYAVLNSSSGEYGTPKYSVWQNCSSGIEREYTINGYWRIEKNSTTSPLYAVTVDCLNLVQVECDTPVQFDFERAPFYFFSINNAHGKQFVVDYAAYKAEIYYSENLNDMLKQSNLNTIVFSSSYTRTGDVTTDCCEGDILYFLVRPYDYDCYDESEVTMTIQTPPEMQDDYMLPDTIREAVAISDSEILFSASSISVLSAVPKNLYLFDTAEKKVTLLKECDSEVGFLTEFGNGVLFAEGSKIWYFDKATKAITAKCVASNTIAGMCMAGDELFVLCGGQTAEMYETTGWTITKTSITFPGFYAAASLVYIPEKDRVFYITKGISPVDIYDAWYDSAQGKIVNTGSGSPYHGKYTMSVPLKRYGNENALITGDGKVFTVEGDVERVSSSALSYYTIPEGSPYLTVDTSRSLGMSFVDIEFADDCFYTLSNYTDKCVVRKFSMSDRLNAVEEYTLIGQKGSDIVVGADGVQVLSVSLERKFWDSTNYYYQVTATQLDLNLALKD